MHGFVFLGIAFESCFVCLRIIGRLILNVFKIDFGLASNDIFFRTFFVGVRLYDAIRLLDNRRVFQKIFDNCLLLFFCDHRLIAKTDPIIVF